MSRIEREHHAAWIARCRAEVRANLEAAARMAHVPEVRAMHLRIAAMWRADRRERRAMLEAG